MYKKCMAFLRLSVEISDVYTKFTGCSFAFICLHQHGALRIDESIRLIYINTDKKDIRFI